MSRRKRHASSPQAETQLEWLKHRTGYPTAVERAAIIRLRETLMGEIIGLRLNKLSTNSRQYRELVEKYGREEVQRAERKATEGINTSSRVTDTARIYREYRQRYDKFGAGLPFYSAKEVDALYDSYARQSDDLATDSETAATHTLSEIEQLLLMGWRQWDDITPPAIPVRPTEYNVPQPATYPAPIHELLEWGDDLQRSKEFVDEAEYLTWKKLSPALTRMALDPGLLQGWASEKASWAPWHAIHTLGILQAWESAPALAELANLENDWLSDHLPHIWADMGKDAEPSLWMILEASTFSTTQRALAAESLLNVVRQNETLTDKVVRGFEKILGNTQKYDATLNGYLVMFLKDMDIPQNTLASIGKAFEEARIDLQIISPEDFADGE